MHRQEKPILGWQLSLPQRQELLGRIRAAPAEFVAQEEMGRHEGYWFSPDGALGYFQHGVLGVAGAGRKLRQAAQSLDVVGHFAHELGQTRASAQRVARGFEQLDQLQ